jgi:hypothetical protein
MLSADQFFSLSIFSRLDAVSLSFEATLLRIFPHCGTQRYAPIMPQSRLINPAVPFSTCKILNSAGANPHPCHAPSSIPEELKLSI